VKPVLKVISFAVLAVFLLIFLRDCSLFYGNKDIESDDLVYYTHDIFRTCFAGNYTWPSDTDCAVLDIPDTCDGYRVTALGGYIGSGAPCPFVVIVPGTLAMHSCETLPESAEIEQYHLVINIGKSLKEDRFIAMERYHRIGQNRFVQILVSINCSEENQYFYSEDGKLFRRSDNSLVDGFFYYSDYSGSDQN